MKSDKESFTSIILKTISAMHKGEVFTVVDFLQYAERNTIRVILKRLCDKQEIVSIVRGIYYRPPYSEILGEYLPPDPIKVAKAIGRANSWNLIPSGESALNILGLSTQVPSVWEFLSDGPYKKYNFFGFTLKFKRTATKTLIGLSDISTLVIQALRALGQKSVTHKTIAILQYKLTENEKKLLMRETTKTIEWIRKVILEICMEGSDNENSFPDG
ncbi:MAG: DUF6088 family protein [Bacilli bacterium]|jgi:hypothetical protein